jgi:hypothetical protein
MMKAKMTNGEVDEALGCSTKTISRRTNELGLHRRAARNATPNEVLREVRVLSLKGVGKINRQGSSAFTSSHNRTS